MGGMFSGPAKPNANANAGNAGAVVLVGDFQI